MVTGGAARACTYRKPGRAGHCVPLLLGAIAVGLFPGCSTEKPPTIDETFTCAGDAGDAGCAVVGRSFSGGGGGGGGAKGGGGHGW